MAMTCPCMRRENVGVEVVVFGSANVDFICYVERLPRTGETLHGTKFVTASGGKGANQCVAAAKLGARTAMIAKLGVDVWGSGYFENLKKEGINVDFVEQVKGETTGIAQIAVAETGENNIVIVSGANNLLSNEDVTRAKDLFENAKVLICQFEVPISATLAALENFSGISILNAAPAHADAPQSLLKAATIFCVNETEAALMSGIGDFTTVEQSKKALAALLQMGANDVIITLGAQGAVYAQSTEPTNFIHVPVSRQVENVVDTTGAGDAFLGALAYFMARYPDLPMHQYIGAANDVAAYSVQFPGTQTSFPNLSQVDLDLSKKTYVWANI